MNNNELRVLIGQKLCALRIANGLSTQQIATMLDIAHQQVHKYETGKNMVHLANLLKLTKHFKVPLEYFYQTEDTDTIIRDSNMSLVKTFNLCKYFAMIRNSTVQETVYNLVKNLAVDLKEEKL